MIAQGNKRSLLIKTEAEVVSVCSVKSIIDREARGRVEGRHRMGRVGPVFAAQSDDLCQLKSQ